MTVYERLCCFKSPNWCNYQDLLNPRQDYLPANIETNLPSTAVDSYLGRLIQLALLVNDSVEGVTAVTMDSLIEALSAFNSSGVMWSRAFNPKIRKKVDAFLELGLPASWIKPLIQVFLVGLWSSKGPKTSLNDPIFYQTIVRLSEVPYNPVQEWFYENPKALSPATLYEEC